MNRYLLLTCLLGAFFYLSSCESYSDPTEKTHQSDKPIVLTSFYPKEGGARDKILLDGKNFGTDVSKIKVYFNNARASVVSSSGSRIYAIVPRLPGDNPRISVVVDTDSVAYEETYAYHTQALVSTVTGNGETSFLAGTLSTAQVYGKYNTTPYDKLKLDLMYIRQYSLLLDMKLILMTPKIMLMKESTEGVSAEKNNL